MMTEYQKQKLDELIHLLAVGLTWLPCDEDCFKKALRLAKEIREPPSDTENSAESSVMDMYSAYVGLEIIRSKDFGNPFVFPKHGGGSSICAGITLDRFVELLAMRQAREEMTNEEAI